MATMFPLHDWRNINTNKSHNCASLIRRSQDDAVRKQARNQTKRNKSSRPYRVASCKFCGCRHIYRQQRLYDYLPSLLRDDDCPTDFSARGSDVLAEINFLQCTAELNELWVEQEIHFLQCTAELNELWVEQEATINNNTKNKALPQLVQITVNKYQHKRAIYQQTGHMLNLLVLTMQ